MRVRDRVDVLEELFAKANRLTLMWAFPFGAGLALFGADLIVFVLGDEWRGAIVLLGGLAVAVALQQVGYNWFAFYRARGESWPQAVESAAFGASFALLAVPGALLWGSWGFVAGRLGCTLCVLARAARLRAAAAAGRAAGGAGGAGGGAGGARLGARAGRCGSRCGAASGRCGRRWWSSRCGWPCLALAPRGGSSGGLLAELRGYLSARRERPRCCGSRPR